MTSPLDMDTSPPATSGHRAYAALAGSPSSTPTDESLEAYLELRVAIEQGAQPGPLLARFGLSAERWIHIDRHWRQRAEAERQIGREMKRLIALQRMSSKVA